MKKYDYEEAALLEACMCDIDLAHGVKGEDLRCKLEGLHDVIKSSVRYWTRNYIRMAAFVDADGFQYVLDEYGNIKCYRVRRDGEWVLTYQRQSCRLYDPSRDVHTAWTHRYVPASVSINIDYTLSNGTDVNVGRYQFYLHQVVAMVFKMEEFEALCDDLSFDSYICVNHMDTCHWHNEASNLEWVTSSDNTIHGHFCSMLAHFGAVLESQVINGVTVRWLKRGISAYDVKRFDSIESPRALQFYKKTVGEQML